MELAKSRRHLIFALISFASPVAAFLLILGYQSVAHTQDWVDIGQDARMAGALLALAEVIQIGFAIFLGTLVGLIFAALSVRQRRKLGLAALVFNGIPFILLAFFIIRGLTRGF